MSLLAPAVGRADDSQPSKAVRECIERNGARYATPDKAWISQYVSLEDACRARFGNQGDVTLTVTPLATGVAAKTRAGSPANASTGTVSSGGMNTATKHRGGTTTPGGKAAKTPAASPLPVVQATLQVHRARASVIPDGLAPAWLWAILLGLPISGAAVRAIRRR